MFDIYARSFLEATRFSSNTRPDPRTQRHLDAQWRSGNVICGSGSAGPIGSKLTARGKWPKTMMNQFN